MGIAHRTLSHRLTLLVALIFLCLSGNTFAHVALEKSIPAANAQLNASPPELVMTFEHPVLLMTLTLTDAVKGTAVDFHFNAGSTLLETHHFPLPQLVEGRYTINWTAMDKDGHKISSRFMFVVGALKEVATSTASKKAQ